jgi:hypothetical protein
VPKINSTFSHIVVTITQLVHGGINRLLSIHHGAADAECVDFRPPEGTLQLRSHQSRTITLFELEELPPYITQADRGVCARRSIWSNSRFHRAPIAWSRPRGERPSRTNSKEPRVTHGVRTCILDVFCWRSYEVTENSMGDGVSMRGPGGYQSSAGSPSFHRNPEPSSTQMQFVRVPAP